MWWQIASTVTGVIALIITVFFYIYSRREKVEIRYPNVLTQLKRDPYNGIQFEYSFYLILIKGRDRFISEINIEFNNDAWEKLWPTFEIPRKLGRFFGLGDRTRLEIGKPMCFGLDSFFKARREICDDEWQELDNRVQALWHRYKIGWQDSYGKTHWKSIDQRKEIEKQPTM